VGPFERLIDALIIISPCRSRWRDARLALKLTGGTLNVYSQIGLVTLVGLTAVGPARQALGNARRETVAGETGPRFRLGRQENEASISTIAAQIALPNDLSQLGPKFPDQP
jgi:hypothetical protein